jgi:hypothetical protein
MAVLEGKDIERVDLGDAPRITRLLADAGERGHVI